ncbi:TRADD-N-associated membrane domain-containing protein [Pseudidiomarina sp. E22-M8]|uniref:TRADD-N-associated membrane domain-containing protein n=1 Tax=Pseudidiomarina sp. E22-M8 TaxID=3424768 RepID=UPI00403D3D70
MIYAIIIIIVGIAVFFSGIWEQSLVTIILGALLELIGWVSFFFKWRAAKKQGNMTKND